MKWLRWFLLAIALIGLVILASVLPVTAPAAEYCATYNSYGNWYGCYTTGNCPWWASYMRPDLNGASRSDAKNWLSWARDNSFPVTTSPVIGSIAVFPRMSGYGHVAYVVAIYSDNSFDVTEMMYHEFTGARFKHYAAGSADGFIGFKCPTANSTTAQQKITQCYNSNIWLGGIIPGGARHPWYPSGGNGHWIWIEDRQFGSIVYDQVGGASRAYAVPGYFLAIWAIDHGCAGMNLGCPIGNLYSWNSGIRQDYQFGYLFKKAGVNIGPYTWNGTRTGPGTFQNQQVICLYTYKLADGYARNGARPIVGVPVSGDGMLPYAHNNLFTTAICIDLGGGIMGNPVLMLDTQAPLYASVVAAYCPAPNTPNQACVLNGGIRNYWEVHGRFTGIGYPFTDEIPVSGQPYIIKQRFIRREGGRWIGTELRYYSNGSVIAVNLFNQQKMGDEITISPDETVEPLASISLPTITFAPNPMTAAGGQITLSLPKIGSISIAIYDATGRHIRQIATTNDHPAGNYTFGWDGQSDSSQRVASGVYFVRLSTPDNINTQRIVILR